MAVLRNDIIAVDRASATFAKVGRSVDSLQKKHSQFATVATTALSTVAITAFAKSSIQKFAEVQDSTSALEATYGDTGRAIITWARDSGDALNLSQREALSASATFANFGKAAGLTGQQLEQFTTPLITRAAEAASYFGGTTSDAITAFSSALMGEMEPIRKYGVLLDDARLRAKALEMGLISSTKEALTPQNKVLAANALILEQTSQAQGDIGRTADSMANKIKDSTQKFEDLQAVVGEALAPAFSKLLDVVTPVVQGFTNLSPEVRAGSLALAGVGAAALLAAPRVKALVDLLREWSIASPVAAENAKNLAKGLGAVGVAYAALAGAAELSANWFARNNIAVDDFAKSASKGGKAADEDLGKVYQSLVKLNGVPDWAKAALGPFGQIVVGGDIKAAEEQVASFDQALTDMVSGGEADKAARMVKALGLSAEDQAKRLPGYTQALKNSDAATKNVTASTKNATSATNTFSAAWQAMTGTLSVLTAVVGAKDAQDEFAKSLKAGGTALSANTAAGRANITALNAAVVAIGQVKDAQEKNGTSTARATAQAEAQVVALRAQYVAAGGNAAAFDALTASIGRVPSTARTSVSAPGLSAARTGAQQYRDALSWMDGRTVTTRVRTVQEIITNPFGTRTAAVGGRSGGYDKASAAITQGWGGSAGAGSGGGQTVTVQLVLDGQVLQTSLLRLKRERGGTLGLS